MQIGMLLSPVIVDTLGLSLVCQLIRYDEGPSIELYHHALPDLYYLSIYKRVVLITSAKSLALMCIGAFEPERMPAA